MEPSPTSSPSVRGSSLNFSKPLASTPGSAPVKTAASDCIPSHFFFHFPFPGLVDLGNPQVATPARCPTPEVVPTKTACRSSSSILHLPAQVGQKAPMSVKIHRSRSPFLSCVSAARSHTVRTWNAKGSVCTAWNASSNIASKAHTKPMPPNSIDILPSSNLRSYILPTFSIHYHSSLSTLLHYFFLPHFS
jgi:hypothetical protein